MDLDCIKIAKLRKNGMPVAQIARNFECSHQAIYYQLDKAKKQKRNKKPVKAPVIVKDIIATASKISDYKAKLTEWYKTKPEAPDALELKAFFNGENVNFQVCLNDSGDLVFVLDAHGFIVREQWVDLLAKYFLEWFREA